MQTQPEFRYAPLLSGKVAPGLLRPKLKALANCCTSSFLLAFLALILALFIATKVIEVSNPIMEITTKSSINVKPWVFLFFCFFTLLVLKIDFKFLELDFYGLRFRPAFVYAKEIFFSKAEH